MQLGTVMTDTDYWGKGYARILNLLRNASVKFYSDNGK